MSDKKKVQLGMSGIYLFALMSFSVLLVALPLYMKELQYTDTQIGFVFGGASFVSIFASLVWGTLDDKYKKTQLMFRVIFISLAIISLLFGVVKPFVLFLTLRMAFEAFNSGNNILSDKTAIQMEVSYGIPFNHVRVFGSLGFAIVLFPVLYLVDKFNNYQIAFVAMAIFFILAFLSTTLLRPLDLKMQQEATGEPSPSIFEGLKVMFTSKPFIIVTIIYVIMYTILDVSGVFQAIHLTETLGASNSVVSWATFISAGISEVPFMFLGAKIQKKFGWFNCIVIAASVFLVRFSLESVVSSWQIFLAIRLFHGISVSLFFSPILMLARRHIPEKMFSTTVSLLFAMKGISVAIFSPLMGNLIDNFSSYVPYVVYAVGMILALLILAFYYWKYEKAEELW